MQGNDWIICGYFLLGLLVVMLKGKSLIDYTNLFSPIQYEKKDEIILKSFQLLETKNFVHK